MNKVLIIKHINGETTPEEAKLVYEWIDKSPLNEAYYINLKNAISVSNLFLQENDINLIEQKEKDKILRKLKEKLFSQHNLSNSYKQVKKEGQAYKLRQYFSYAAGLILFISISLNIYLFNWSKDADSNLPKENISLVEPIAAVNYTYYTERGIKGNIMLPDSSRVWLNSGSKITFPQKFSSDKRRVIFEGEGYFEVSSNKQWPMEVVTKKGMKVEVLGTKFLIKSYSNEVAEKAILIEGSIEISNIAKEFKKLGTKLLLPGNSLSFSTKRVYSEKQADTLQNLAWKRGEMIFDQTPISEVVKIMERWYGVDIKVLDKEILNYKFTATFSSESVMQVLDLLRFTSYIDFNIQGKDITLFRR